MIMQIWLCTLKPATLLPIKEMSSFIMIIWKPWRLFSLTDWTFQNSPSLSHTGTFSLTEQFSDNEQWRIGWVVVTEGQALEAGALLLNFIPRKLNWSLWQELSSYQKKKVNINPNYTFMAVHAIWKERVLLRTGNKNIKYTAKIQTLLQAVTKTKQVVIMPCLSH